MKTQFLQIARMMNREFGVEPLLYGSLGLQQRLGVDLHADDIDILIPDLVLWGEWTRLIEQMAAEGFRLYDEHEHAFVKAGVSAAFASIENLGPFAGVEIDGIERLQEEGVRYLLLGLEDYLRVYTASSEDGYRQQVKNKQDQKKIELIQRALGQGQPV